jgi:hypothetical protein
MKEAMQSWRDFKALTATPTLPALGPTPRAGRLPLFELNLRIDRFFADTKLDATLQPSVRSAALLWHDYLDESHTISQNLLSADGSFLHGIMHRREPDYPNAKYWFHRVGKHRSFPDIAKQVTRLLDSKGEKEFATKLAPRGDWDPFAFVDACSRATESPLSAAAVQTLQAVQEIEFDCLLAHLIEPKSGI